MASRPLIALAALLRPAVLHAGDDCEIVDPDVGAAWYFAGNGGAR